jgi:hypothetical protein
LEKCGSKSRMCVAVLEVEHVLAGLLDRHRQLQARGLGVAGDVLGPAELLVDEDAEGVRVHVALLDRLDHALVDEVLGVGDRRGLLRRGVALDPEHLLLERAAMVEREDVQLAVIAQRHGQSPVPVYLHLIVPAAPG